MLWLKNSLRFNFGRSWSDNRLIMDKIAERLPVTVGINVLSLLLVFLVAIPLGIKAATRAGGGFDNGHDLFFLPAAGGSHVLAGFVIDAVFLHPTGLAADLGNPVTGSEYFTPWHKLSDISWHLILPVFVSSLGGFAVISRYMRSSMMEALNQPYIYTARAKGSPPGQTVYKHALRNALLPIVTLIGLSIPGLLGGSVIFESIFALPGLGQLFFQAVMTRDLPLIMAEVVLGAVLTILGNLIADISYAYVDPRILYK